MELFYKLSIETIDTILERGFQVHRKTLLWYLCKLNPFGDRPVQITWEKAKEAIGISKATFYRALAQLKETGLLICGSLRGFSVSLKNETSFSKVSEESQECVSQSQKCDSTLYIDLKTFSYSPERRARKNAKFHIFRKAIQMTETVLGKSKTTEKPTTANISQNSLVKPISQGEEKYSAALRTNKRTEKFRFDWLPEGPWNIERQAKCQLFGIG